MPKLVIHVNSSNIEGGKMLDEFDVEIQSIAIAVAKEFEKNGKPEWAKGSVIVQVDIAKHPEYDDGYDVSYEIKKKYPNPKRNGRRLHHIRDGVFEARSDRPFGYNPKQVEAELDDEFGVKKSRGENS